MTILKRPSSVMEAYFSYTFTYYLCQMAVAYIACGELERRDRTRKVCLLFTLITSWSAAQLSKPD